MKIRSLIRCRVLLLVLVPPVIIVLFFAARSDSALNSDPVSIQRYIAIDNVCAWPNLTLLQDGSIAAIIHNTPSHGTMEGSLDCWISKDGLFWNKYGNPAPNDPNTVRMNAAAGLTRNGDLIVLCSGWTNEKQPGKPKRSDFRDAHIPVVVCRSADKGKTWTQDEAFPHPEEGWSEFVPFGDIFIGDDGSIYASAYTRGMADDFTVSARLYDGRRQSWFFCSYDDGKTWKKVSLIGPNHNETTLLYMGGKNWLAGARLNDPGVVELFSSKDNGATWQGPRRLTDPGQLPGHLLRLRDGRVLFTYGNRSETEEEKGILAKLSIDEGKTWGPPIRIAWLKGDMGYPSSVQRADGKIVTAYYSSGIDNHMRYHMGVTIWSTE